MENNSKRSRRNITRNHKKEDAAEIARIRGIVRKGFQRGRLLGYPTLNVYLHRSDLREGVYIATVRHRGRIYHAAAFVGAAKTFGLTERKLEVFVFDFHRTVYGEWVSVYLLKYIRPNKTFASVSALQKAIARDVLIARTYFSS